MSSRPAFVSQCVTYRETVTNRDNWPLSEDFRRRLQEVIGAAIEPARQRMVETAQVALRGIDIAAFAPRIDLTHLQPAFDRIRRLVQELSPPNWVGGDAVDFERTIEIVSEDAIPLVWIPRVEIVSQLTRAPDRAARVSILLSQGDDVAEDCSAALNTCTATYLAEYVALAQRALAAWRDGHHEAAQALAVITTEDLLRATIDPDPQGEWVYGHYKKVADKVRLDPDRLSLAELRQACVLAPVAGFYEKWTRDDGTEQAPLRRHGTIHGPSSSGVLSTENALVSTMLLTSLLRELQETENLGG